VGPFPIALLSHCYRHWSYQCAESMSNWSAYIIRLLPCGDVQIYGPGSHRLTSLTNQIAQGRGPDAD